MPRSNAFISPRYVQVPKAHRSRHCRITCLVLRLLLVAPSMVSPLATSNRMPKSSHQTPASAAPSSPFAYISVLSFLSNFAWFHLCQGGKELLHPCALEIEGFHQRPDAYVCWLCVISPPTLIMVHSSRYSLSMVECVCSNLGQPARGTEIVQAAIP